MIYYQNSKLFHAFSLRTAALLMGKACDCQLRRKGQIFSSGKNPKKKKNGGRRHWLIMAATTATDDSTASNQRMMYDKDGSKSSSEAALVRAKSKDTTFEDLGLSNWLVDALSSLSIRKPSEIQKACVPAILSGKDVIGGAKTGSGKTAAFALPILQKLSEDPYGIFALVLTPTRFVRYDNVIFMGSGQLN
jgi:superfamily II DNA/RNA helicase